MSLKIGNIVFTTSTQFNMVTSNMAAMYQPLRGNSIVVPSGKSITSFNIVIDFANIYYIKTELIPLLSMFTTTPIVNIDYEPLRVKMGVKGTMVCGLKSIDVTTVPGTVDSCKANVEFVWCNWQGLSKSAFVNEAMIGLYNGQAGLDYLNISGNLRLENDLLKNKFSLDETDPLLVLAAVKFNITNTFATIPILGQVYPRIQHVGGSITSGSFVLQSPGPDHSKLTALTAFMESNSRLITNRNAIWKNGNVIQTRVYNDFINMCGLKSIIINSSTLNEIPNTASGQEYTVMFYDAKNIEKFKGPELVYSKSNDSIAKETGKLFEKWEKDSVFRDAMRKQYPEAFKVFNKYINSELGLKSSFPLFTANEGMLTDVYTKPSLKTYTGISLENAAKAYSELYDKDKGFLESDFAATIKTAKENMLESPVYRSYTDLNLDVTQNPYDIFIEQHNVDYNGIGNSNEHRKEIYKFAKPKDENTRILQGERPSIDSLVEADLKDFLQYDYNNNRFSELFPAVKLYIVETDDPYDSRFANDLYEVKTYNDIMLIQSKDTPFATLVCSIHNLFNQFAVSDTAITKVLKESEKGESTSVALQGSELENKISKLPIAAGVRIQLKYGFTNDASTLSTIFNGEIMDVEVDHGIITFTASDAGKALLNTLGEIPQLVRSHRNKNGSVSLLTTDNLDKEFLKELVDEVFKRGATRGDTLALYYLLKSACPDFIYPPVAMWFSQLRAYCKKYLKTNTSIFTPPTLDSWDKSPIIRDHIKHNISLPSYTPWIVGQEDPPDLIGIMNNTTPWSMLNELVDLYPGTCITTRPYEDETTVFIGDPDLDYIVTSKAVDANLFDSPNARTTHLAMMDIFTVGGYQKFIEEELSSFIKTYSDLPVSKHGVVYEDLSNMLRSNFSNQLNNYGYNSTDIKAWFAQRKINPESGVFDEDIAAIYNRFQKHLAKKVYDLIKSNYNLTQKEGNVLPNIEVFRRTHYAGSSYNLIYNSIRQKDDVYNGVAVNWVTSSTVGGEPMYDPENEIMVHIPGIKPEDLKIEHYQPNNVFNRDMATKLGVSLLCKEFANVYDGEIGLTSNRHIRPYDYVYLNDHVNQLYGAVEVRDSILYANKESGVTYIVVPDLIVKHSTIPINSFTANYWFAPLQYIPDIYIDILKLHPSGIGYALLFPKGLVDDYKLIEDDLQIVTAPLIQISNGKPIPFLNQQKYFGRSGFLQDAKDYIQNIDDNTREFVSDVLDGLVVELE